MSSIDFFDGETTAFYYRDRQLGLVEDKEGETSDIRTYLNDVGNVIKEIKGHGLGLVSHGKIDSPNSESLLSSLSLSYLPTGGTEKRVFLTDQDGNREIYCFAFEGAASPLLGRYRLREYFSEACGKVVKAERYTFTPFSSETAKAVSVTEHAKKSLLNVAPLESFTFEAEEEETTELDAFNLPKSSTERNKLHAKTENGRVYENQSTAYTYDDAHRHPIKVVTEFSYVNEPGDSVSPSFSQVELRRYNAQQQLVYTESYIEGEELTTGKTVEETFYDEKGNVKKSYTYNTLDSASKFYTEAEYGRPGEVLSETDATGRFKTAYTYLEGTTVPQTTKLPNGSEFSYGYDASDNVTSVTQSTEEGEENSTRTLTTLGLVTEVNSANHTVNYEYDEKRRQTAVKLDGANYVSYTYVETKDANGRKIKDTVTTTLANDGNTAVTKESDANGNLLSVSVDGQVRMSAGYNARNQVTSQTDTKRGETSTFAYDADTGERTSATRIAADGAAVLSEGDYLRNTYGKLTAKTLTLGSDAQTYTFAYKNTAGRDLDFTAVKGLKFKVKTDKSERNAGKVVYSTDGDEN